MSLKTKVTLFMTILLVMSVGFVTAILCYQAHSNWEQYAFRLMVEKNRGTALSLQAWLATRPSLQETPSARVTGEGDAYGEAGLQEKLTTVARQFDDELAQDLGDQMEPAMAAAPPQQLLLDTVGDVLYAGNAPPRQPLPPAVLLQAIAGNGTGQGWVDWAGKSYKVFYQNLSAAGWIFATLVPEELFLAHQQGVIAQSAVIATVTLLISLMGISLLLQYYSRPLAALTAVAEQVGAGNRQVSFPIFREREFRTLSVCLENMRSGFLHMFKESQAQTEEMHSLYQQVVASEKALHVQYEELRRKEAALRISERRFKLAIEASQNALWELDLASGEFLVSPSDSKVFQMPEVGCIRHLWELVLAEDRPRCDQAWQEYLSGGTPDFSCEFRLKNGDNGYLWVLSRARTVETDEAGRPHRVVGAIADISELKRCSEEERYQMTHDHLTGLYNRQGFLEAFQALTQDGLVRGYLAVIDVDDFKLINDVQGYQAGDEVLKAFAWQLKTLQAGQPVAGRMSGDVFLLFLPEINEAGARNYLQRLTSCLLETPLGTMVVHASGGLVAYSGYGQDVLALLQKADLAAHAAKKQGKQRFLLYEPAMQAETECRVRLKNGLRRALQKQELYLVYQPVYRIADGHIHLASFEALARWHSDTLGLVSPAEFIPVAEESGFIIPLGEWAIREACRFIATAIGDTGRAVTVFVNISMRQLLGNGFVDKVCGILNEQDIPASCLGMEITESVLAADFKACVGILEQLKALGIKISLDDFGTGYSSLTYLRHLPIDVLKLDKSFIDVLGEAEGGKGEVLAAGIIQIAQQMGYQVVAEGVERLEQLRSLIGRGCDYYQGFYLSKPLPVPEALELLPESVVKRKVDFFTAGPAIKVE
ncbi:EAL domain-containing protein [Propionispora hippei]|uniref:PAS domain S-box-containing protein/diguanylate cyclase (GGDEF) domain-containing protein n=1 Tax=Propionispora hippei DSM 15287 TaxID=1123003 RepID=A0A1M6EXA5_9FIRM|nr:EAL domain-containing protein [Propionispora hippei]SHI90072.1 PAS domain S-box-containing protein/diguanylate cyclase (GGDEF) domain-containing protein [Propionispora hippei DSM 15287]